MATTHQEVDEYCSEIEAINDWVSEPKISGVFRFGKTIGLTIAALSIIAWALVTALWERDH